MLEIILSFHSCLDFSRNNLYIDIKIAAVKYCFSLLDKHRRYVTLSHALSTQKTGETTGRFYNIYSFTTFVVSNKK
jgi:hypothetical protein